MLPLPSMALQLRVLRSIKDYEASREEYSRLLEVAPHATPFHSFEWIVANLLSFANQGVHVLEFRQSDSTLVGVVPLVLRSGRRYLRTRTWLEFAGQPFADYGGFLVQPGFETEVAEKVVEHFSGSGAEWDAVHLDKMMSDDPFARALLSVAQTKHAPIGAHEGGRVWRLAKDAHSANQAGSRSLDRAAKRLSEQGALQFEVFTSPEHIESRLNSFFQLHTARFAAKGLHSPLADAQHQEFYRNAVRCMAPAGQVWLSVLACGGLPVAMRISFRRGERLHLYSTCFAQEFARYSPSMLQLRMLLDYSFANGIEVVDFGIGESPHKEQPGAIQQPPLLLIELYTRRAAGIESKLFHAAQRLRARSTSFQRAGKLLRRIFPHDM